MSKVRWKPSKPAYINKQDRMKRKHNEREKMELVEMTESQKCNTNKRNEPIKMNVKKNPKKKIEAKPEMKKKSGEKRRKWIN